MKFLFVVFVFKVLLFSSLSFADAVPLEIKNKIKSLDFGKSTVKSITATTLSDVVTITMSTGNIYLYHKDGFMFISGKGLVELKSNKSDSFISKYSKHKKFRGSIYKELLEKENNGKDGNLRTLILLENKIKDKVTIKKTDLNNIYEISYDEEYDRVRYVDSTGKYELTGQLVNISKKLNLTHEQIYKNIKRTNFNRLIDYEKAWFHSDKSSGQRHHADAKFIDFPEAEYPRARIVVFTNIDCPYCKKLHKDISKYSKYNFQIRYLISSAFNQAGHEKSIKVLCSDNRNETLHKVKTVKDVELSRCNEDYKFKNEIFFNQKALSAIGGSGTPAILLNNGELIKGYAPADKLIEHIRNQYNKTQANGPYKASSLKSIQDKLRKKCTSLLRTETNKFEFRHEPSFFRDRESSYNALYDAEYLICENKYLVYFNRGEFLKWSAPYRFSQTIKNIENSFGGNSIFFYGLKILPKTKGDLKVVDEIISKIHKTIEDSSDDDCYTRKQVATNFTDSSKPTFKKKLIKENLSLYYENKYVASFCGEKDKIAEKYMESLNSYLFQHPNSRFTTLTDILGL